MISDLGSVMNSSLAGSSYQYGLFGEISKFTSVTISSSPVTYGFTGNMVDLESGLNRTMYRQYDSITGRWLSHDPIGFDAEEENYYRYVKNMPTRYVDPNGLYLRPWQIGISLAVSGAVSAFNDMLEVCLAAPNSAVCKRLIPKISQVPKPGDPNFCP